MVENMEAVTYTNLKQNLNGWIDKVIQNQDSLIITQENGKNVVLISIDEYNSLVETTYLLSNDANAEHLRKSVAQYKAGKAKTRELYEDEQVVYK